MKIIISDDIKRVVLLDKHNQKIKSSVRSYPVRNNKVCIKNELFNRFKEDIISGFVDSTPETYRVFIITYDDTEILLVTDNNNCSVDFYSYNNIESFSYWPSDKIIDNLPPQYRDYMVTDYNDWCLNQPIFESMGMDYIEYAGMTGEIPYE